MDLEVANLKWMVVAAPGTPLATVSLNVTKNFELRQTARDEEVEALRQAKVEQA